MLLIQQILNLPDVDAVSAVQAVAVVSFTAASA